MTSVQDSPAYQALKTNLSSRLWRLNNLYWITDKSGQVVKFQMNWAQKRLFKEMHYLDIILKARQLGFTTFIQIYMLDSCIFEPNVSAGVIAHSLDDAQRFFRDKIKFAYERLPETLRAANPATEDSARSLAFANGSSIRVGTSLRSGTLQYLHISEYGKLCARFPEKAKEVRTGALNTVQAGQKIWIESTAEGQEGDFYDLVQQAQAHARQGGELTPLDFKFHFFPWHQHPEYELDVEMGFGGVDEIYFNKLEERGIALRHPQKAWYVKKAQVQRDEMKREYPSTPEEAFEASIEGTYYANQIAALEEQGRIASVPYDPRYPVQTGWDIGIGDENAIWFFQQNGPEIHFIDYVERTGWGIPDWAQYLQTLPYAYGHPEGGFSSGHWGPHDVGNSEWGTSKTRKETAIDLGINFNVLPRMPVDEGIHAVRLILPRCRFDKDKCAEGIRHLRLYRREWDDVRGVFKDKPRHDEHSHGADAFRTVALAIRDYYEPPEPRFHTTFNDYVKEHFEGRKGPNLPERI